jgi:hypothetical protein
VVSNLIPEVCEEEIPTSQSQDLVPNIDSSFILAPIERILAPAPEELFHCLLRAQVMQGRKRIENYAFGDTRRMLQTKQALVAVA